MVKSGCPGNTVTDHDIHGKTPELHKYDQIEWLISSDWVSASGKKSIVYCDENNCDENVIVNSPL